MGIGDDFNVLVGLFRLRKYMRRVMLFRAHLGQSFHSLPQR